MQKIKEFAVKPFSMLSNFIRTKWRYILVAYLFMTYGQYVGHPVDIEKVVEKRVEVPVERVVYVAKDSFADFDSLKTVDNQIIGVCGEYVDSSSKVFGKTAEYFNGTISAKELTSEVNSHTLYTKALTTRMQSLKDERNTIISGR